LARLRGKEGDSKKESGGKVIGKKRQGDTNRIISRGDKA